ncbi:hypothetical protein SNE40_011203 [Patella caerulea]|uniref:Uncharacterized protein n=1 Tax=Patella caerulea TaxID=87958 RepID=A0AAN8PTM9_PATCE
MNVKGEKPWFNDAIRDARKIRRRAERTWRLTNLTIHWEIFRAETKRDITLVDSTKKQFYNNKLTECGNDQKTVFKIVDSLLCRSNDCSLLPEHTCNKTLADNFAEFFQDKISKIRLDIMEKQSEMVTCSSREPSTATLGEFIPFTEPELKKIIMKSKPKTC